jgi:pimeloyl-ACP methyl ester carboxylesterase
MTIIRNLDCQLLFRICQATYLLLFFSSFQIGNICAAQLPDRNQHIALAAQAGVPEPDGGSTIDLQPRLASAQYQGSLLSTFDEKTRMSTPVTETYPEDMICNKDAERPDHNTDLHEQVAQTERGPIGYYRFGHGSPLFLITGYLSTLSEWNAYFLAELAKEHDVIVFDNRGIGRSATSTSSYDLTDLVLDTAALIKALGFRSASVLGWSMGGMIAQRLVLDRPDVVDRLILLNSAPPGHNSTPTPNAADEVLSGHGSGHFESVMKLLFPAGTVKRADSCFKEDMFRPNDYTPARISAKVSVAQESIVQNWARDDRSFAALHHVEVPTLVLAGKDDTVLVLRNSVVLSDAIPQAKLVELQYAGHAMMYQYPKELAHLINSFISGKQ